MPATLKTKYEGIQRAMNKFNVIRVGDDTMFQHQMNLFFQKKKTTKISTVNIGSKGIQRAMNRFNVIRVGDDTMCQHQKYLFFSEEKNQQK